MGAVFTGCTSTGADAFLLTGFDAASICLCSLHVQSKHCLKAAIGGTLNNILEYAMTYKFCISLLTVSNLYFKESERWDRIYSITFHTKNNILQPFQFRVSNRRLFFTIWHSTMRVIVIRYNRVIIQKTLFTAKLKKPRNSIFLFWRERSNVLIAYFHFETPNNLAVKVKCHHR